MTVATPASETSLIGADRTPSPLSELPARGPQAAIALDAIVANWRAFQRLAGGAECAAVVKADAYGFGAEAVAPALAKAGARTFFTATLGEALRVRRALGDGPTIVALNGPAVGEMPFYEQASLTACLNSLEQAAQWAAAPGRAPVIHIDTGMNRLGLRPDEVGQIRSILGAALPSLVMSHLACASDPDHPKNAAQQALFVEAAAGFTGVRRSLSASAGAQLGPAFAFDMIRPGIGLYGWDGMDRAAKALTPAATVSAPVLQRRRILAGETAGYGATFTAPQDLDAVIVACGYADGFFRSTSGSGLACVGYQGKRLGVLGRVSMDLLIVDATAAPDLHAGDRVELLGPTVDAARVAAAAGTLPYEVFTTFVGRAARSYTSGP